MKNKYLSLIILLTAITNTLAFADAPHLYDKNGKYLGNLSANKYDPNSVSNPYGRYGSKYSADSINNPYGKYGSKYGNESARNPYATNAPKIHHGNHHGNH